MGKTLPGVPPIRQWSSLQPTHWKEKTPIGSQGIGISNCCGLAITPASSSSSRFPLKEGDEISQCFYQYSFLLHCCIIYVNSSQIIVCEDNHSVCLTLEKFRVPLPCGKFKFVIQIKHRRYKNIYIFISRNSKGVKFNGRLSSTGRSMRR